MKSSSWSSYSTTTINETTAKSVLDSCFSFPGIYLQTSDSGTTSYIVNAALNVILTVVTTIANSLVLISFLLIVFLVILSKQFATKAADFENDHRMGSMELFKQEM